MHSQPKGIVFLFSLLFIFGVGVLSSNQEQQKPEPSTPQAAEARKAGAKIAVMAPRRARRRIHRARKLPTSCFRPDTRS